MKHELLRGAALAMVCAAAALSYHHYFSVPRVALNQNMGTSKEMLWRTQDEESDRIDVGISGNLAHPIALSDRQPQQLRHSTNKPLRMPCRILSSNVPDAANLLDGRATTVGHFSNESCEVVLDLGAIYRLHHIKLSGYTVSEFADIFCETCDASGRAGVPLAAVSTGKETFRAALSSRYLKLTLSGSPVDWNAATLGEMEVYIENPSRQPVALQASQTRAWS